VETRIEPVDQPPIGLIELWGVELWGIETSVQSVVGYTFVDTSVEDIFDWDTSVGGTSVDGTDTDMGPPVEVDRIYFDMLKMGVQ
jgi:hypothetical protein